MKRRVRQAHPTWGRRTLLAYLARRHPGLGTRLMPAVDCVCSSTTGLLALTVIKPVLLTVGNSRMDSGKRFIASF